MGPKGPNLFTNMTIQEKNEIVIPVFVKIMAELGRGKWTVLPVEEAHKLPGDASHPGGFTKGSYSIGYFHKFMPTSKVAEYFEVFVAARVSDEDPAYWLYTFKQHPGSFNPRNGGTPPETEEIEIGHFGTLEPALRRVITMWVEEFVGGHFENAWEVEAAKHAEES